jgi:protein-S-isoprenylcysteine O-methyltransferase Ste14
MEFFPQLTISLSNAFWFSLLFWISNLIILKIYPSHYKDRVLKMPQFEKGFQKIISTFNFFLFQGLIIIVLFMPLLVDSFYFVIGLVLFIISFIAYIMSLIAYATGNPDKPVTKGIYKLSRNPQQISTIFMWIGIGLMTSSIFII